MTQIHDRQARALEAHVKDAGRGRVHTTQDVRDLIKGIVKDQLSAAALAQVVVKELPADGQQLLGKFVAHELRGQLPQQVLTALVQAQVGPDMLQQLVQRLANSASPDQQQRFGQATTPDAARAQASDGSMPQQALRWSSFVQRVTHVPGGQVTQDRAGSAVPKGEGATLAELIGARAREAGGPGLRNPKLVERSLVDLSPTQRALLMKAAFGEKLGGQLLQLGIGDPLQLVKAGSLPQDRATLAESLGMDRGKLLSLLFRAEMLKIGPGKNGELGVRPDLLPALAKSGVAMLGTLAALRSLPREQLSVIYGLLRGETSGFANTMKGARPPVKRDLQHWARTAARRPSDILLTDYDEKRGLSKGDAQELIQAWYLENLLWDTLQKAKQYAEEERRKDRRDRERSEEGERREREGGDGERDEPEQQRGPSQDDDGLDFEFDTERGDHLMCFFITDYNTDPSRPESMRRMYVCIDPDTGAILPQQVEATLDRAPK